MLNTNYLYDLQKWEVCLYGEKAKDDKVLGLFDTKDEADTEMKKLSKKGGE
ncbi:hypothetical protein [Bacillus xiapuensis]|uniref:Uncharacterized protein n=1 Tax=Bacillus xiapuensis TaxID=2014075 RepID=A0ABU6NAL0_9BACI|nr:hypothetical protein [Bacillus xiapuensis]